MVKISEELLRHQAEVTVMRFLARHFPKKYRLQQETFLDSWALHGQLVERKTGRKLTEPLVMRHGAHNFWMESALDVPA